MKPFINTMEIDVTLSSRVSTRAANVCFSYQSADTVSCVLTEGIIFKIKIRRMGRLAEMYSIHETIYTIHLRCGANSLGIFLSDPDSYQLKDVPTMSMFAQQFS